MEIRDRWGQEPVSGTARVLLGSNSAERLDSWKLISGYVNKSSRTLQRWHQQYGLPIHRLDGQRGAVYAYTDELNIWMRRRGRQLTDRQDVPEWTEGRVLHLVPHQGDTPPRRNRSAELVARARQMWRNLSWGNLRQITRLFRDAVDSNSQCAEAWAGLATTLAVQAVVGGMRSTVAYRGAAEAVRKAESLRPELPETRTAVALLNIVHRKNWPEAKRNLDEILEANPELTQALGTRAILRIAEGDFARAMEDLNRIVDLHALSLSAPPCRAWCYYLSGNSSQAVYEIQQATRTGRISPFCEGLRALALIREGRTKRLAERLEKLAAECRSRDVLSGALGYLHAVEGRTAEARMILQALAPGGIEDRSHEPYAVALVLIGLGEKQQAVQRLEQAYREGSVWSLAFAWDPMLEPLRGDPNLLNLQSKPNEPAVELPARETRKAQTNET
jgi:tetratricopeptide (TPR) repeat protein